ncbi:hypothetical protein MIMGU_mgv1a016913mg [Erythranthe guttata]|uniref:Uncharacterized protein n=1 Tax=Erythranthe guttata TaxID=4155 RepID=A0A022Q8Z3_ERYGU|nr:hypothetical protein MIMGU_mgv1a016913mg [Erythranthe guttata]
MFIAHKLIFFYAPYFDITTTNYKLFDILRALRLSLRVFHIPITRALVFVPISARRHTMTLVTTYSAILEAPVPPPGLGATDLTSRVAKIRAIIFRHCCRGK